MQQLSGTDASFLYAETPTWHMHAGAVLVLDPSTAPAGFSSARVLDTVQRRAPQLGLFRHRLVEAPLALGPPAWVEVPDLDVGEHIHTVTIRGGGLQELGEFAGEVMSTKLDRTKPLWEIWLVDGLADGRVGEIVKVHHACVDGMRAVELGEVIFDLTSDAPAERPVRELPTRPGPSTLAMAARTAGSLATTPVRLARGLGSLAHAGARLARVRLSPDDGPLTLPFSAPRGPLNGRLTAARDVALCSLPRADLRAVKDAYGVTYNDAVLGICTGALRRHLLALGSLPDRPLVAQMPVGLARSTSADSSEMPGNQVSAMGAALPVHLAEPGEQMRAIRRSTLAAKQLHAAIGEHLLHELVDVPPPLVLSILMRAYTAFGFDALHPPVYNVLVSNVPGANFPLYSAGARVEAMYPIGPLLAGSALNITVHTSAESADFGIVVCPDVIGDPWAIAAELPVATKALQTAA